MIGELEKKAKKAGTASKETAKLKKDAREKNRELKALRQELGMTQQDRDELSMRFEEMRSQSKKSGNNQVNTSHSGVESGAERSLRSELATKDAKLKE